MTNQNDIKKLAQQMAGSMKSWEHPTFCVIIDESHIAVTQNIGCSPLLSLYNYKIDTSSQYGGVFPLEAWERGWRIRNSYLPEYGSV